MSERITASCHGCGVEPGDHDGGLPFLHLSDARDGNGIVVCCSNCGVSGRVEQTEEAAIAAWNSRPREERLEKLLREAHHAVEWYRERAEALVRTPKAVEAILVELSADAGKRGMTVITAIDAELGERP